MLDRVDTKTRIEAILAHWADLTRSYELVQTARAQLDKLEPVAEFAAAYDRAEARIGATSAARAAVPGLVEQGRVDLLSAAITGARTRLPVLVHTAEDLRDQHKATGETVTQLEVAVQQAGGTQLLAAQHRVERAEERLRVVRRAAAELGELAERAGVVAPDGVADWPRFAADVSAAAEAAGAAAERAGEAEFSALQALDRARKDLERLREELAEAGRRESNVPLEAAQLRGRLAADLGLDPGELPYAAELIAVDPDAAAWEAAAERLEHPLAMSLLVPEEHYPAVAAWVDAHHLGRRLVYYRVPVPAGTSGPAEPRPGTMAANLQVRPGTPFSGWLRAEVARRYDHACVAGPAELARHQRAVTRAGQIRDSARHEKDDRRPAGDRRFYVLGWNTAARKAALTAALPTAQKAVLDAGTAADAAGKARGGQARRGFALEQLTTRFTDPREIDVAGAHGVLAEARGLHETLLGNPKLAELTSRREQAVADVEALAGRLEAAQQRVGDLRGQLGRWEDAHGHAQRRLAALPVVELPTDAAEALAEVLSAVGQAPDDVDRCDQWGGLVADALASRRASAQATQQRNGQRLVVAMKEFATLWPQMVTELGTDPVARGEYLALRRRLSEDDLPRYEAKFREELQTNAIHELVSFSAFLERESRRIAERIATINEALLGIEYQPGTYICLEHAPTVDVDIRAFRADLRDVTANTLMGDDEAYAEARFLKVKELLDRFAGREGSVNADKAWTEKVTDVRAWHTFAASERTRDEGTLVEHYTDSGGKSGGQKEKLAYTILAASLSYQYGLAEGRVQAFRFVMIDEAFGRGSDESTRFGLELSGGLGLQLLVATPLQKIDTIAPYVSAVGYVRAEDRRSRLLNIPIGEFRVSRAARAAARRAARAAANEQVRAAEALADLDGALLDDELDDGMPDESGADLPTGSPR